MNANPLNPVAKWLGYAGLVPFVVGTALVWLVRENEDAHAFVTMGLTTYAAVVIAFLGAVHWGLGMRQAVPSPTPFVRGAALAVLGWVGALMPPYAGLVVHGVLLLVSYALDRRTYPALGASAWLTLRFRLSAVAALSCFIAAQGL